MNDFFSYDNFSQQSHNTCGQAVIATLVDRFDVPIEGLAKQDIGAPDGKQHYPADQLLQKIVQDFGPNWPWKNAVTTRKIIKRALSHYGIPFQERVHKFGESPDAAQNALRETVEQNHGLAIVLLDVHRLGLGPRFVLHWAIVVGCNDEGISLATWGRTIQINWKDFMAAWKCWFVPGVYRYYQLDITAHKKNDTAV